MGLDSWSLTLNESSPSFLVEALGISLLHNMQRSIDENLHKRDRSRFVQLSSNLSVFTVRGDEGSYRDSGSI